MKKKRSSFAITCILLLLITGTESCYHYRVLTTNSDPATEYQKRTLHSYLWGIVNSPKDFVVPNCNNNNALDEVQVTTSFGSSILTIITLGIYCPVEIKWKCHKPPHREGNM